MTTYRCAACGKDVEVEVIEIANVIEVTPCEVCIGFAVEAVKEEEYSKGFDQGYDSAYEEMEEEEEK